MKNSLIAGLFATSALAGGYFGDASGSYLSEVPLVDY